MAQPREPHRRPPTHTVPPANQPRSFYLITGLAVGGLWLLNRDKSLLYHAVQMTAVMSTLTLLQIVLQIVLRRRAGAPASPGAYALMFGLLLGAKLVLVAVGVGAEWLLAPMTARPNAIVAAVLVVLVTAFGPVVDRGATNRAIPATRPDQASPHLPAPAAARRPAPPATFRQHPRSPNGSTHDRVRTEGFAVSPCLGCPGRSHRERTDDMTDHMPGKALLVSADRLVDGRGGAPLADAGVLVDTNGTISWVGPMAQAPQLPDDAQQVALAGTLLPGFIDTHVHFAVPGGGLHLAKLLLQPPPVRVLQIAASMHATVEAGVTTVRDLGFLGPKLAMMATTGATPAPRLLNAISMLSSTGGHGDVPLPAGVDLTELFNVLDLRMSVADGPDEVTKHARQLIRDGAQVLKVAATGGISTPADGPDDVGFSPAELRAVVEVAASRGRRVAAHSEGTQGIANAVDAGVHSIEHGTGLTPDIADRMAAKAGVRIATGTDAGLGIEHGQNLIELAYLVSAGLSPMDAIVAGTATAAEVCGLGDQLGTLEPGKRADLVVAAGDPLDDIKLLADAANITLVVQDGRIVKQP